MEPIAESAGRCAGGRCSARRSSGCRPSWPRSPPTPTTRSRSRGRRGGPRRDRARSRPSRPRTRRMSPTAPRRRRSPPGSSEAPPGAGEAGTAGPAVEEPAGRARCRVGDAAGRVAAGRGSGAAAAGRGAPRRSRRWRQETSRRGAGRGARARGPRRGRGPPSRRPPRPPSTRAPSGFLDVAAVRSAAEADGLKLPDSVYAAVVAALATGKHVVIAGPAGSGKTTLALADRQGRRAGRPLGGRGARHREPEVDRAATPSGASGRAASAWATSSPRRARRSGW